MEEKMMKKTLHTILLAGVLVWGLSLGTSCKKYNPFDSYNHAGFEREDTGGKPGKGGLFADGYGTEESPYGIATAQHLKNMSRALVDEEMIYFRLLDDIDLSGVNWAALNPTDPYKKFIDFDGNGHVIINLTTSSQAYGSFFGVLCGNCYDVGFLNANIQSSRAGGVIGGYIGLASPSDDSFTGRVERVYVTGSVTANGDGGGICGNLGKMVDMTPCVISDCYSLADVSGTNTGGLAGRVLSGSRIERSYACGEVITAKKADATYYGGGIVGSLNGGTLSNVIAWNSSVRGDKVGTVYGNKQSGSLVENGYAVSGLPTIGTIVAQENVSSKDPADLQAVATAWGGIKDCGWYPDGAVSNGYPICKWQQERGDYALYSGHGGPAPSYDPGFKSGSGTEADPYIIENMDHLRSMHDLLEAGHEYWLRLDGDVNLMALPQWDPVNVDEPYSIKIHFDGNNHKISNLKSSNCKYASFFGVLNGECKNLTMENCTVTTSTYACGILGGFAGTTGGLTASVSNVKIVEGTVNSTATAPCGMLFGNAANATITGCTVSGTVTSTNNSTKTSEQSCGGLLGKTFAGSFVTNCTNNANVSGIRLVGGIIGYVNGSGTTVSGCTNNGSVTGTSSGSAKGHRTGGIIGHMAPNGVISKCVNTGSITNEAECGGIVGYCEKGCKVSKCYSNANIRAGSPEAAGGITGVIESGTIEYCYSKGSVSVGQQTAGGIVGQAWGLSSFGSITITECWSSATISGKSNLGGLAGMLTKKWLAADETQASNITMSKCIAWNPTVTATVTSGDESTTASCGAIAGYTYIKNTLTDCLRKNDMNYTPNYAACAIVDQENVSPEAPLSVGTAPTYCYPYHGKAADSGKNLSQVAIQLGWSSSIWNLGGSEPTLK